MACAMEKRSRAAFESGECVLPDPRGGTPFGRVPRAQRARPQQSCVLAGHATAIVAEAFLTFSVWRLCLARK